MTERLLRAALRDSVSVTSAGTGALLGHPMTPETAALVRLHGGNAERFSARQLHGSMLKGLDLVLALTRTHRSAVLDLQPTLLRRSFTLIEFARLVEFTGADATTFDELVAACAAHRALARAEDPGLDDVLDPYGRDEAVYATTAQQISRAVETISRRIKLLSGGPIE